MSVIILLPVFEPSPSHLLAQLDSLVKQSHDDFICVVSYDGPIEDQQFASIRDSISDKRFEFRSNEVRLGTYRHFEYLIASHAQRRPYFALCDQDDVWLPHRISIGLEHMADPAVSAVSVNGQIVDDQLMPIRNRETFEWFGIAEKKLPYRFLLNQITGASVLCRSVNFREAVPFPVNHGPAVHDHWVYLTASATGRVVFDNRVSWLYRQHEQNQIGAAATQGFARRALRGVGKAMSIVRSRFSPEGDVVLRQAKDFYDAHEQRWPHSLRSDSTLLLNLTPLSRVRCLSPRKLIDSRLESMRLALSPIT